jgi:hypothetical protein
MCHSSFTVSIIEVTHQKVLLLGSSKWSVTKSPAANRGDHGDKVPAAPSRHNRKRSSGWDQAIEDVDTLMPDQRADAAISQNHHPKSTYSHQALASCDFPEELCPSLIFIRHASLSPNTYSSRPRNSRTGPRDNVQKAICINL